MQSSVASSGGKRNNVRLAVLGLAVGAVFSALPTSAQLKFAAFGNYGFDLTGQQEVAETLKKTATEDRLSFLVSPGSNFAGGISSVDDEKWSTHFENVYSDENGSLKMPFFTVLGADDWVGNYQALQGRTDDVYGNEVAESKSNAPKWTMPNWWFHYLMHFPVTTGSAFISSGHKDMSVGLVFIDTWILSSSFPFSEVTEKAWLDLEKTLEIAPKVLDYIIVVGNRPVYSSGSSKGDSTLQYYLQPLLQKAGVDMYISGYDYDMEVIERDGISYVNCGTGSVPGSSAYMHASDSKFFSGEKGFCLFELGADGITTKFVKAGTGETLFEHKQAIKERKERSTIDQFNSVSALPEVTFVPIPEMGRLPDRDAFVRVVGTLGLCVLGFISALAAASGISKAMK